MTDLALREQAPPQQFIPTATEIDPTGQRLVAWAKSLGAAKQLADALCETAFVPQHFRGKPADGAAAILYGDEIGLTPGQALQNIHVISGQPGLYARTMVALVQSKGHLVWTEAETPSKVVVCGRRLGTNHTERSEWTIDRARKAGYTSNRKYEQTPEDMLYARAAATVCRRIAADALAGLAYALEELELEEPATTTTVSRADAPKRTARRAAPQPAEPDLDETPAAPDQQAPQEDATRSGGQIDEPGITAPQLKKLHALLNEHGFSDRERGLAHLSSLLDRPVDSSKSLTKSEASRVIDQMESAPPAPDTPDEPAFDDNAWLGGEQS